MKKTIFLVFAIALSGCVKPIYVPYDGTQTITGDGGFLDVIVPADNVGRSVFEKEKDYKYDTVRFYISGLPESKKCTLVGYLAGQSILDTAKIILELDANTATRSSVSLPVKFDNNAGILDAVGSATDWYTVYDGSITKTRTGFNIFECK